MRERDFSVAAVTHSDTCDLKGIMLYGSCQLQSDLNATPGSVRTLPGLSVLLTLRHLYIECRI